MQATGPTRLHFLHDVAGAIRRFHAVHDEKVELRFEPEHMCDDAADVLPLVVRGYDDQPRGRVEGLTPFGGA